MKIANPELLDNLFSQLVSIREARDIYNEWALENKKPKIAHSTIWRYWKER